MKKVIVVQIEKVVRETWVVDCKETVQYVLQAINNPNRNVFCKKPGKCMEYVKTGERIVSAEIFSQETKEVEFAPWDGYEK